MNFSFYSDPMIMKKSPTVTILTYLSQNKNLEKRSKTLILQYVKNYDFYLFVLSTFSLKSGYMILLSFSLYKMFFFDNINFIQIFVTGSIHICMLT